MIAVAARTGDEPVIREFFELFKTPWKFHDGLPCECDVLICSGSVAHDRSAKLVLIYASEETDFERKRQIRVSSQKSNAVASWAHQQFPIYGDCVEFHTSAALKSSDDSSGKTIAYLIEAGGQKIIRIGYDLFSEVRHLLTHGQPASNAEIPALDRHIALLRDLILCQGLPLLEVPPVPANHKFIACLTHDVDHVGVRNHRCDHTLFGFLYRATLGSSIDACRGRKTLTQLRTNWRAALSLPLVHLGLADDFWYSFERYLEIERGLVSTFFLIPRKGDPGQDRYGRRQARRAASYDVRELTGQIQNLLAAGDEVGVHGIDAWRDPAAGRSEFGQIAGLTSATELGVRMHWLYFDADSPALLEQAGFSYDSTVGYNETIGYRAGTTQVYKPFNTETLLELPMHVMDTAMFYPSYLNLSSTQAASAIRPLLDNAAILGGVLTVNWHDRSIVPERLWDEPYAALLESLKTAGAWFATASQAVRWFRMRRSVKFHSSIGHNGSPQIHASVEAETRDPNLPGLLLRIHQPNQPACPTLDLPLAAQADVSLAV